MSDVTLAEAYEKWADDLVRYATVLVGQVDAPDVVADTFAHLLAARPETWADVRDPRSYLFGAVANRARMHHRSAGRRRARAFRRAQAWPTPYTTADGQQVDPDVIEALRALSEQQRAVTYLNYWEDLSPDDIARVLGVREGTVRKQLTRARARLREVLQ